MSAADTGGPAFPAMHFDLDDNEHGMTLRDYFAAHAPAEPQPWFQPVMPERPVVPSYHALTDEQRRDVDADDWGAASPWAQQWLADDRAALQADDAWVKERDKQRYLQWPYAWADAVLKARQP